MTHKGFPLINHAEKPTHIFEFLPGWYYLDFPGHFELRVEEGNREYSTEEIDNAVKNFLAHRRSMDSTKPNVGSVYYINYQTNKDRYPTKEVRRMPQNKDYLKKKIKKTNHTQKRMYPTHKNVIINNNVNKKMHIDFLTNS
eukprot:TRINITY_DN11671_c0_g1_i1.p1 TRINITY_DN11671_c0_g1~~TRINITY_DN11671_c0_g1_i1.p1  ORF type:complete len:141 (-),score=15.57 TRINITY_DN11671_c0_g1_i1:25-447(-)